MTKAGANRVLMIAAALLYLGPLLAGLSGFGWRAAPVFLAIYLLWDAVTRPMSWPRDRNDWTRDAFMGILVRAVVLAAIIALLFGLGRGIGGMAGTITAMPLGLPIFVSLIAVPLARSFWAPDTTVPKPPARDDADKDAGADQSAGEP